MQINIKKFLRYRLTHFQSWVSPNLALVLTSFLLLNQQAPIDKIKCSQNTIISEVKGSDEDK